MWVSTTKLAKIEGVTTQTIRRRIESGLYDKVKQTEGGHFRVFITQQRRICYARVSSSKQLSSIDTQKRILLERYPEAEFISDIASAFNFKRKGLQTILESVMLGHSVHIVVTTKDRLVRSGFELIKGLVELSGGRIEILDDSNNTSESFDTAELVGFLSFCNSYYGRRSAERRKNSSIEKDQVLSGE
ncbi:recombinase family protein [Photobacterium leiognathi]|uniref:recombinase family protein n=1 Tax=Photobacterium leiognathi TaxID=553611 RepID=UPI001EE1322D|nr:recombinase family protein [Photobacterium leiognathi]MCG3884504.1 recombinase family protein [Photobacterium leiognathi]